MTEPYQPDHDRLLARDLLQVAGDYWTLRGDPDWEGCRCELSLGICFALATLRMSERTSHHRPCAYDQISDLLNQVEPGWEDCIRLYPFGDLAAWEPRAWLCLLLAQWLAEGDLTTTKIIQERHHPL